MQELIDRIELRKDFCNMCEAMQPEMIDCEKKGCMSMQIIDDQPAIEPEVRHGRWIVQENGLNLCSACGVTKVSHLPFCGHCGARMDLRTPTEVQLDEADSVMMGGADNGNG